MLARIVLLVVALSLLSTRVHAVAYAQAPGGSPAGVDPAPTREHSPAPAPLTSSPTPPAGSILSAVGMVEMERVREAAVPVLSRHLLFGGGLGAAAGAAFGVAVIGLADCGGDCASERVVGVAGHALAGAVTGALIGGLVYLLRR